MEENQKNKNRGKYNFSIVLSFCVAVFAIVSLVAVGFNQVSYAAETPTSDTGTTGIQSFEFKQKMEGTANLFVRFSDGTNTFQVPIYYRMENGVEKPIFCVEHDIYPQVNGTYTRFTANGGIPSQFANDNIYYGVLYILRQSKSAFGDSAPGISGQTGIIESASTQAAIWAYLYDVKGHVSPHSFIMEDETGDGSAIRTVISDFNTVDTNSLTTTVPNIAGLNTKINNVVQAARNATPDRKLQINVTDKNFTKTDDNSHYISSKFSVSETTSSGSLKSYVVSASGVDGVKVVDASGNEKSEFPPTGEFYIQVPADKISEGTNKITVTVTGTFDNVLSGTYYVYEGRQTVVTVTDTEATDNDSVILEIAGSPDTGMNSVQTIYFIGLIVLLCGIGIIYANAKPVEEK